MNILCAVELDDSSHKAEKRKQRDEFLDRVFEAAAIKYFHLPLKFSYSQNDFIDILNIIDNKTLETKSINEITNNNIESEILSDTPICPKCQVEMVKRITSYGTNKGKAFYGCKNFPRCREIKEIAEINI